MSVALREFPEHERLAGITIVPDILATVRPILAEATAFINGDGTGPHTQKEYEDALKVRNLEVRFDRVLDQAATRLLVTAAGVTLRRSVEDAQEPVVRRLYEEDLEGILDDRGLTYLTTSVLAVTEKVRSLRELTSKVIPELDVDDPRQQFELMKLLSKEAGKSSRDSAETTEAASLQILYFFNILDGEHVAQAAPISEKLEAGEFDTFIAQEILQSVAQPTQELVGNSALHPSNFLRLSMRLTGKTLLETIEELADPENLALWPPDCKKALDLRRAQYLQRLGDSWSYVIDFMERHSTVVSHDNTEADVSQAAIDFKVALAKRLAVETSLSMPERIAARAIVESDKRRRRSRAEQAQTVGTTATGAAIAETKPEPRKLTYITSNGEALEGSPEYEALFEDYLKAHVSKDGLKEDLAAIGEYLRTIDLSSGLPRGIKKMNGVPAGGLIRGGGPRIAKVYQLKPDEAVGLPTTSEEGHKLRVLFALRNGTVGLLGIETKGNIATLERNIGLRGRNNRK
jgi:hypothetical protein